MGHWKKILQDVTNTPTGLFWGAS